MTHIDGNYQQTSNAGTTMKICYAYQKRTPQNLKTNNRNCICVFMTDHQKKQITRGGLINHL